MQRNKDNSRSVVNSHPVSDILRVRANPETSFYNWHETGTAKEMLYGNSYDQIDRNGSGDIIALWQIPPNKMQRIERRGGKLYYTWTNDNGDEITKSSDDILHVAGFGYNGIVGKSLISLASEAIGLGLSAEGFTSKFFADGTHPAGVLEMDSWLGDKKAAFRKDFKENYAGLGNTHSVMVLEGGLKYKPLTMPIKDAMLLESREFQKIEITSIYHVPPHKVSIHGANSNYNNLEQENQNYIDSCLSHYTRRRESAFNYSLLTKAERASGLFIEYEMKALLRGDMEARQAFYQMFLDRGVPLNKVLALENMDPVDGGDVGFVMQNMMPITMAEELAKSQVASNVAPAIEPVQEVNEEKKAGHYETRTIKSRQRIIDSFYPLFESAAQRIINREGVAVKREVEKQTRDASESNMGKWLDDFYGELDPYIKREMGPVLKSFTTAIIEESIDEIGERPSEKEIREFVKDYIDGYTQRHIDSSYGQLVSLLGDELEALETRVDEWAETRPTKISKNETVRGNNAAYQMVAFAAALPVVWRIRGKETCRYCRELNGRKISKGQAFQKTGDEVSPSGMQPMKVNGLKTHPPLHGGCDCYISI
jgi:HK97 family phage portal protein